VANDVPKFRDVVSEDIPKFRDVATGKPERVSDPFKQAVAGISDIATGIPAILGLAGSGLQAGYGHLTSDDDKPFKQRFAEAMSEGTDKSLLDIGLGGREFVNEALGIAEPISTEDQAARLIGGFIPIPGIALAANASRLAKAANLGINLLTPAVKRGPGFARRGALQLGLGTGIEQGIRALTDDPDKYPLIFSERALSGGVAPEEPSLQGGAGLDQLDQPLEGVTAKLMAGTDAKVAGFRDVIPKFRDVTDKKLTEQEKALIELDRQFERNDDLDTVKTVATIIGAVLVGGVGIKMVRSHALKKLDANAPFGVNVHDKSELAGRLKEATPSEIPGIISDARIQGHQFMIEEGVDKGHGLGNALREQGHSADDINAVVSNSHADVRGVSNEAASTGNFKQGTGINTHSLDELDIQFEALGKRGNDTFEFDGEVFNKQKVFDEAMVAGAEINRVRNTSGKPALWRQGITNAQLQRAFDVGQSNTEVKALMKKYGDVFDAHLDYSVKLKLLDQTTADNFRTTFKNVDGTNGYVPLYDAKPRKFFENLKRWFGFYSNKADEMDMIAEHHAREVGGKIKPLGVRAAARTYSAHNIEHANISAYHNQALGHLSATKVSADGTISRSRIVRTTNMAGEEVRTIEFVPSGKLAKTGRETRLIGVGKIGDDASNVKIKLVGDDKTISKIFSKEGQAEFSVPELKKSAPFADEVFIVQQEGQLRAYHVPDAVVRAALDVNPQLSPTLKFFNHYKRLFTASTVGKYSVFAPIANIFAQQQIALTTFAREGFVAGWKTFPQSIKGTYDVLMTNGAKEVADFLAQRLATNTGIGRIAPELMADWQQRLAKRYTNSLVTKFRGETGRIGGSIGAETFTGSLNEFKAGVGNNFSDTFGADQMGLVIRMWKGWNNAMHEGPAFGAMQKRLGEIIIESGGKTPTPRQFRDSADWAKTVAGDMRRIGASEMAKRFNAAVPFSAAMVQSWNALGTAAKHDFGKFMAGAATLIGLPTVTEMLHAEVLGMTGETWKDDKGKEWTYNDYYWNGYTTQQRADNFIYMIPGKPPWEAIIMPVSPEWGLFRGAVMDGLDMVLGLSEVGNIAQADRGNDKVSRDQFKSAFIRAADIPVPPPVAAAFAAIGVDLRFGFQIDKTLDNPEDPGTKLSFWRGTPLGQGERVSRRGVTSKFVGGHLNTQAVAVLNEIFGSGGALYVKVHEAFNSGMNLGEDPSVGKAFSMSVEAFGQGLLTSLRWTQPLFGKTLRPTANDEIAKELFLRRKNLDVLIADGANYFGGGLKSKSGRPNVGDSVVLKGDPIHKKLVADANNVKKHISNLDKTISDLRRRISIIGSSTNFPSLRARDDRIDAITLEIQAHKAKQMGQLSNYEARVSKILSDRFKREINIDLSTQVARPGGLASQVFPKLPQTSR